MTTVVLPLWSLLLSSLLSADKGEESSGSLAELYTQTILGAVTGTLGIPYDANATKACRQCLTMVGPAKLRSFGELLLEVWQRGVPGDVLEAGVWRGGVGLYAAALMRAYSSMAEDKAPGERRIVLADSFTGIPEPLSAASSSYHKIDFHHLQLESVKDVFQNFGLLSERVRFAEGPFLATLPSLRLEYLREGRKLSVLRIDADMYESYLDVLYNLYDLVSVGGYVICDDCVEITETDRAFAGFCQHHLILDSRLDIPGSRAGASWQKSRERPIDRGAYQNWVQARAVVQAQNRTKGLTGRLIKAVERLHLIRLESYMAESEQDLHTICVDYSFPFVVLLVAPLSAESLTDEELMWSVAMGEALRPDWRSCALVVVIDSATTFKGSLDEVLIQIGARSWRGTSGFILALGILCATENGIAEEVLDALYSIVQRRHAVAIENVHRYEGAIRAWIGDACRVAPP